MSGLINTGTNYRNNALSGFVRNAAMQREIDQANDTLDAQAKAQRTQNTVTSTALGAGAGWLIGAKIGSVGGPLGAAIGAGAGFLFSQLF